VKGLVLKMIIDNFSYENIINSLLEGFYIVDRNRKIIYWNSAAEQISGFKSSEVVGRPCSNNILTHVDVEGKNLCEGMCPLAATINDSQMRETKVFLHHKDGHRVPVTVRTNTLKDQNGVIIGGIELFTDISRLDAYEGQVKELEKLALLDKLTQLPNRHCISKELDMRFAELKRYASPFGILLFNIDHFKKYNDLYGHELGDKTLQFVSSTLQASCRPFDLYGRWSGEEFIGILRNVDMDGLETIGNRMKKLIESSYVEKDGNRLNVTVSIGATLASLNDTEGSLLKRADELLYKSKNDGRNRLTTG